MVKYIVAFGLGAAVGAGGSMLYFKKKYEKLADAEVEKIMSDMKEHVKQAKMAEKMKDVVNVEAEEVSVEPDVATEKAVMAESEGDTDDEKRKKNIAVDYSEISSEGSEDKQEKENTGGKKKKTVKNKKKTEEKPKPYIISDEEFSWGMGLPKGVEYENMTLDLYADGALLTYPTDKICDPEEYIGMEIYNQMLNGEIDDTVYVRNDEHKVDYEVCRSDENYEDVLEK